MANLFSGCLSISSRFYRLQCVYNVDIFNCLYESTQSQASWLGYLWGEGGGHDSDEAKTCRKRTKEQVQAKTRNRNNTFQSDTPAGRRILWFGLRETWCLWADFFLAMPWRVFVWSSQSISRLTLRTHSRINSSFNPSTNQPINPSINGINCSANAISQFQFINESIDQPANPPISQATSSSSNLSINPSSLQTTNPSIHPSILHPSILPSILPSNNESTTLSVHPRIDQSIKPISVLMHPEPIHSTISSPMNQPPSQSKNQSVNPLTKACVEHAR